MKVDIVSLILFTLASYTCIVSAAIADSVGKIVKIKNLGNNRCLWTAPTDTGSGPVRDEVCSSTAGNMRFKVVKSPNGSSLYRFQYVTETGLCLAREDAYKSIVLAACVGNRPRTIGGKIFHLVQAEQY
jgi:hypothetical protein